MLRETTIDAVYRAILESGLDRMTLLVAVPAEIVRAIAAAPNRSEQVLCDLRHLEGYEAKGSHDHPLLPYLRTAAALADGRAQFVLQGALDEAQRAFTEQQRSHVAQPRSRPPALDSVKARVRVYISAEPAEVAILKKLVKHLAPLQTSSLAEIWHRGHALIGRNVDAQAAAQLALADVVIFILSADALASATMKQELGAVLQRRRRHEQVDIAPVLARSCDLAHTPFEGIGILPQKGRALTEGGRGDAEYRNVAVAIRVIVERRAPRAHASSASPDVEAARGLLDVARFPWRDARARRLREILADAYPDKDSILDVALGAGIPAARWNPDGSAWALWRRVINAAVGSGALKKLIDLVLADDAVRRYHGEIKVLIS